MVITKTRIDGVFIIEPEPRVDHRGYFERIYCAKEFKSLKFPIVQINQSFSKRKGTIRGPHMQKTPHSEIKLVSCIKGSIFDVVVDIRKSSKTYGQWISNVLSAENQKMTYIPKNVMHGFQSLEDDTIVQYPVSAYYSKPSVRGIRWNDQFFNILWPIKPVITSKIDDSWPLY